MKEISIFIDESGDFGKLNPRSPYYIVTMVFHDQAADFICTMKLTELKLEKHNMSVQELRFFGGEDGVRKNYLKDLKKYELN